MKSIEDFPISKAVLRTTFGNGEIWDVPVLTIAKSRAAHYVEEFGDGIRSLILDTLPLFEGSHYAITDWALNNMYWSEIREDAVYRGVLKVSADKEMEWCHSELTTHRLIYEPEKFTRGKTGAFFPIQKIYIYDPGNDTDPPQLFTIEGTHNFADPSNHEDPEAFLTKIREKVCNMFYSIQGVMLKVYFEEKKVPW